MIWVRLGTSVLVFSKAVSNNCRGLRFRKEEKKKKNKYIYIHICIFHSSSLRNTSPLALKSEFIS